MGLGLLGLGGGGGDRAAVPVVHAEEGVGGEAAVVAQRLVRVRVRLVLVLVLGSGLGLWLEPG